MIVLSCAGFTPPRVLIDLLNRYFDCQVPVILEHGAEVLKFMGDGLLAIFTINGDEAEVCTRALVAARQAQANIAELSGSAMPGLRFENKRDRYAHAMASGVNTAELD